MKVYSLRRASDLSLKEGEDHYLYSLGKNIQVMSLSVHVVRSSECFEN